MDVQRQDHGSQLMPLVNQPVTKPDLHQSQNVSTKKRAGVTQPGVRDDGSAVVTGCLLPVI
jgi:hypothetical protein